MWLERFISPWLIEHPPTDPHESYIKQGMILLAVSWWGWLNRIMILTCCLTLQLLSCFEAVSKITWCKTTFLLKNIIREILASRKISKVLATCHLYFLKCLLLKKQIWLLFMLAKINALLACLQMLAKTIQYPYNYWLQVGKSLTLTVRESTKNQTGHLP